jgi:glycosyltransferase involved in cell wall biosynthesis
MRKSSAKVSAIFPAYNEEENIEIVVLTAHCLLGEMVEDFEIIIVNDGSTDGTRQICLGLQQRFANVRLIDKQRNEGYGWALRDGIAAARFDLIFFSDSDRQFDIVDLKDLLQYIDNYDIVIGFRKNRQDSWLRKFLAWGYHLLARFLLGVDARDIDCAFKLFRKRVFDRIRIESRYYFVNTEILAKARLCGFTVKETGVSHFPRYKGESKVTFGDIPRTLKEMSRISRMLRQAAQRRR